MIEEIQFGHLDRKEQDLLLQAKIALTNAYNPYSNFSVGAALLSLDDKIITGANFENAAYSPCICAERSALASANNMGIRKFSHIAVIALGQLGATKHITSPCGVCRQMIFEASQVSGTDIKVIMSNTKMTEVVTALISDLLPLAFGPNDLKKDF